MVTPSYNKNINNHYYTSPSETTGFRENRREDMECEFMLGQCDHTIQCLLERQYGKEPESSLCCFDTDTVPMM